MWFQRSVPHCLTGNEDPITDGVWNTDKLPSTGGSLVIKILIRGELRYYTGRRK